MRITRCKPSPASKTRKRSSPCIEEFVQKFSANPAAVAYGNWQLSQAYQAAGDLQKALDYGDKALAASPHNLDILVSQASIAQQAKNNVKLMDYAAKGGEVCLSIAQTGQARRHERRRLCQQGERGEGGRAEQLRFSGDFRVQRDLPAKPIRRTAWRKSKSSPRPFLTRSIRTRCRTMPCTRCGPDQLNDKARLVAFGEKTLASNPNSLAALLLLAIIMADDTKPGSAAKAITYSQKAIEVAKAGCSRRRQIAKNFGGSCSQHDWVGLPEAGENRCRHSRTQVGFGPSQRAG